MQCQHTFAGPGIVNQRLCSKRNLVSIFNQGHKKLTSAQQSLLDVGKVQQCNLVAISMFELYKLLSA